MPHTKMFPPSKPVSPDTERINRNGDLRFSAAAMIGSALTFSDQMIRFLSAEFPDVNFQRFASFEDMRQVSGTTRLILVDYAAARDSIGLILALRGQVPDANLALVYRSISEAPDLLDRSKIRRFTPPVSIVPTNVSLDVWLSILRLLLCGQHFIPVEVIEAWNRSDSEASPEQAPGDETEDGPAVQPEVSLTRREMQVLPLLAEGKQNKAIADALGLSEHTVKLHTHNIFQKLKVSNRTCAADWYRSRCRPRRGPGGERHDGASTI